MTEASTQIPVTVLTGFLGAGKTTLLNRILSEEHGKKYAVVVNEFGEVGIDNDLIVGSDEEVFEMNNGCICCTVRGDLIRVIEGLMKRRGKFDAIIVETTGLANPAPVAQTFFVDDEVRQQTRLDAIVTVVDAHHFLTRVEESHEAEEQVAFADMILLNKTDIVSPETLVEVERRIRQINAFAPIRHTVKCGIALDQVLNRGAFDLNRILDMDPAFLEHDFDHDHDDPDHVHDEHCGHDHHGHDHGHHHHKRHDDEIASVSLVTDKPVLPARFDAWINGLLQERGADILRSKGILNIEGSPRRYVFQGVHMLMVGETGRPWAEGDKRTSKLVFIGRHLDRDDLMRQFEACTVAAFGA